MEAVELIVGVFDHGGRAGEALKATITMDKQHLIRLLDAAVVEKDEHGNQLRDDGEILIPGDAQSRPYKSAAELMDLLADSERVKHSITWKLTQFAIGRPLTASDAAVVQEIHRSAQQDGGTYGSLIRAIVLSDLVQLTRTESGATE